MKSRDFDLRCQNCGYGQVGYILFHSLGGPTFLVAAISFPEKAHLFGPVCGAPGKFSSMVLVACLVHYSPHFRLINAAITAAVG